MFFLSASILLTTGLRRNRIQLKIGRSLAFLVLAICGASVLRNLGGPDLLASLDSVVGNGGSPFGDTTIALNTSFCFFALATTVLSMDGTSWLEFLSQRLAITAGCIGLFGVSTSAFRLMGFKSAAPFTVMNPFPAATFFVLALVVFLARPHAGLMKTMSHKSPSGAFARRMMAAAIICPPIFGWLGMLSVESGLFSSATAWALGSLISLTFFASLVWQSADSMRLTEAANLESQKRYESLTSAIPQLVWTCGRDGGMEYLSRQWVEYTGLDEKSQLRFDWLGLVLHPDDRRPTLEHCKGAVRGDHAYDLEYRIRRADGVYRWFRARATAVHDDQGGAVSWVGTSTDVHDQKLAADELTEAKLSADRANSSKTQFLANMSHEIRTPIGAIMGFAELLRNPGHTESDRGEFMQIISRNSHNLLRLIDDILDLSKVESGRITVENSPFSLLELISDLRSTCLLRAAEKNIAFTVRFDGQVPDLIATDSLRLKQILSNVVGNAIKFTDFGEVVMTVKFDAPKLLFEVSDTGPGLSLEAQSRLFRSFSQADPTLTRKYGGTGLGLVLSQRLSQFLGGDLVLTESQENVGSTFTATIVPEEVAGAKLVGIEAIIAAPPVRDRERGELQRLRGLNVLVVDDAQDNRTLIATYLKKTGAIVTTAEDGLEGFNRAMEWQPDVILMDVQMPRLDGRAATKKLRKAGFSKPIVALTAHAMREERDRCFEAGCTDYLTKPIFREQLIESLAKYLAPAPSFALRSVKLNELT